MEKKKSVVERLLLEQQRKHEEERQKMVVQTWKLANGATFTKLKPVGRMSTHPEPYSG